MVHAVRTIKVNDDPAAPQLSRSLVWHGLVMKAENPLPFVPVITSCKVVERHRDWLLREIVDRGDPITERVTFHPKRMVEFERLSGRVLGTIRNEIIADGDGDMALRFTFTLTVEGLEAGSAAERQFIGEMENGYLMAVATTLKAMRKLAKDNALVSIS
jgi:hypothetical protein